MTAITGYWASVGVKTDERGLREVDRYLSKIEQKLRQGVGKNGLSITPKINTAAFERHLRSVLRGIGGKGSTALRVNVQVSEQGFRKSVDTLLSKKNFNIPVTATLSKASLTSLRQQLQAALVGVPIHVKVGGVSSSRQARAAAMGGAAGAAGAAGFSWSPNARGGGANSRAPTTPHLAEWLGGKPRHSTPLSAANRRFSDSIMQGAFTGETPNTIQGFLTDSALGGIGRVGSSTMVGRGLGSLGGVLGGVRGAGLGLIGGAALSGVMGAAKGVWTGLATVVTAPFKAIGGAASLVSGSFYRLALAAAPLVAGFAYINKTVQLGQQRQIALNTVSKSLGSSGRVESDWLMNMAQRDGLRYNTLVDPYTTFIASASPAMGLGGAKDVFEAFTQFGLTRGANDISMGLAMKAVSQMAGKGRVQAEEMRGQLGDAPGFGEMQGIFAQAYQKVLGRDEKQAKKGQEALAELNKAMENGQVISAKILPHVAQIARELAEPGLAQARGASFAEQARFANQGARGWMNFREGGGEEGLAYFWRMMQEMGSWWESNGASLGNHFRILMVDLNTFRVTVKEFAEFAWTGESNDLTKLSKEWGLNLEAFREEIVGIFKEVGKIFTENTDLSLGETLKVKITNFSNSLLGILASVRNMLQGLNLFFEGMNEFRELPWWQKVSPLSLPSQVKMGAGLGKAAYHGIGATWEGGGALADVALKNTPNTGMTDYSRMGNGRAGYSPLGQNQIPYNPASPVPQTLPQQMYTPAMQNNMSQNINGKVDITLTIEGNSDLASQIDTPQVQSVIRKQMQEGISSLLTGSVTAAPKF